MDINRILLDLDGVLVDFVGGACRLFKQVAADLQSSGAWQPGVWDFFSAWELTAGDFYGALDAEGGKFWEGLEPYAHARDLYEWLKGVAPTVITTAPILHWECASAKVKWLRAWTGDPAFNDFVITRHKDLMAKPGNLLVDDNDKNVEDFRAAGGIAVLFPAYWNARHAETAVALDVVKQEIREIAAREPG